MKRRFDYGRLGPQGARAKHNQGNCSLELKKVPRGVNNITHLNNHFAKFGKIVNIQVQFGGDPEAALVTFSSHAEANAAYRSTEAVLNNRFIKVFWHNNNNNGATTNEVGFADKHLLLFNLLSNLSVGVKLAFLFILCSFNLGC